MENVGRHPADPSLKPMLIISAIFHGALAATVLVSTFMAGRGENWAGSTGGGAVTVGLVGSVPAIPLPKPDTITESRVVDESKGLYKSEPPPKPVPPPPTSQPIPEFTHDKAPAIVPSKPSKVLETPNVPPPTNAVPYGGDGTPALPYSSTFSAPGWRARRLGYGLAPAVVTSARNTLGMWTLCAIASAAPGCNPWWILPFVSRRAPPSRSQF